MRPDRTVTFEATVERHLDHAGEAHGISPEDGHPVLPDGHVDTLRLAHEVFYVGGVTLYSKSVETYLKETAQRVRVGTINEKRKQLEAFGTWLRADCAVSKITKKVAGRYLADELLTTEHVNELETRETKYLTDRG